MRFESPNPPPAIPGPSSRRRGAAQRPSLAAFTAEELSREVMRRRQEEEVSLAGFSVEELGWELERRGPLSEGESEGEEEEEETDGEVYYGDEGGVYR